METLGQNRAAQRRRALIVDECASTRGAIRDAISPEFDCEEVRGAEEAIGVASSPPQVIIHHASSAEAGTELCRRVRADQHLREIPLLVLGAAADAEERASAFEQGADEYLSEPFHARELLARVRALVRPGDAREAVLRHNRELTRAHGELLQAQRELLEAERLASTGALAAGVAHAINNPLSVVCAGVEEMSDWIGKLAAGSEDARLENAEIGVVLSDVRGNLERIRDIVQELKRLNRPAEQGPVQINVHAEIDRAVAIAHSRLSRVELKRRCEGPPTMEAPPGYLAQILAPVLLSAADAVASSPRPRIEVRTRRVERRLEIVVEDNGGSDGLSRVFDPFVTGPGAEEPLLGSAVCRRLIDRLGGSAQLVRQAGRGTQFRISLPLAAEGRPLSALFECGAPHVPGARPTSA